MEDHTKFLGLEMRIEIPSSDFRNFFNLIPVFLFPSCHMLETLLLDKSSHF